MRQTEDIMGMPITVEIVDPQADAKTINAIFGYFTEVDMRYSTYKVESEISRINRGLPIEQWSSETKQVLDLCEQTKQATHGYFDIRHRGKLDPSGLVKGWAINQAARMLKEGDCNNFYIEAGGDIQVSGLSAQQKSWRIGLRHPFDRDAIIKVLAVTTEGVATSGTYTRGQHIYNPVGSGLDQIVAITVVGPNIYEADRFATAAFAMGRGGIEFIESLDDFEGYMVGSDRQATMTSGFEQYVVQV